MNDRRHKSSISLWIILATILTGSFSGGTGEMALPVEDQIPLMLKILSYDKSLMAHPDSIVVGVLYQDRFRQSLVTKDKAVDILNTFTTLSGHSLITVPVSIDNSIPFSQELKEKHVSVLYVTPLRSYSLSNITEFSRTEQIVTLTGVPQYLKSGLSVSLDSKGGKPHILINLNASLIEGARFHSQLLKLAQIIDSSDG